MLDSSFTALDGMRYKPYGEDLSLVSPGRPAAHPPPGVWNRSHSSRKFTGQTEDERRRPVLVLGALGRAYDPAIGRFVSPDPIVPVRRANPQIDCEQAEQV